MPVRIEVRPYGNGCRFLSARHKMLIKGAHPTPVKDEIVQLICSQGRHITWEDEEKCLASLAVCWQLQMEEKRAEAPETRGAEPEEAQGVSEEEGQS
ncbi:MAG: hypothetical protein ACP5R4_13625 [Armatimonadota bacterium]